MTSTRGAAPAPTPDELAVHLRTSISALVRRGRRIDRLPPVPAGVLDALDRRGPTTTADLALSRGVRHQTMAATVKDLTEAGYVSTQGDPADGRKKILALTAAGRAAIVADREERVGMLARALDAALDADERRVLEAALGLLDRVTAHVPGDSAAGGSDREPITGAW